MKTKNGSFVASVIGGILFVAAYFAILFHTDQSVGHPVAQAAWCPFCGAQNQVGFSVEFPYSSHCQRCKHSIPCYGLPFKLVHWTSKWSYRDPSAKEEIVAHEASID